MPQLPITTTPQTQPAPHGGFFHTQNQGDTMTAQLQAMWATITEAHPYAQLIIHTKKSMSYVTMGGPPRDNHKPPCNLIALSWTETVERTCKQWDQTIHTMPTNITNIYANLGPADQLDLQTTTHTLHNTSLQYLPGHVRTKRLTNTQRDHLAQDYHCDTLDDVRLALAALGHQVPLDTIKTWSKRGHLTKTPDGWPLAQALERTRSRTPLTTQ
ncbi:hypothetical protein CEP80_07535 [Jonesia denitrificans]|nr:hypothetical protein CEP80_07535 [Jonesia denitrificans]